MRPARTTAALVAAVVVVLIAAVWGASLNAGGARIVLDAAPFFGRWRIHVRPGLVVPLVAAVVLGIVWVQATSVLGWRTLLVASCGCAFVWSVALATSAGWTALAAPLQTETEYLPLARTVDDVGEFLRTYPERLTNYPVHVKGHPPGPTLVFHALDRSGLGAGAIAVVVVAIGASAAPASLVALDRLSGRRAARNAAIFAGLAPAVVWMATSFDGLLAGVVAWSVAAGACALIEEGRRATVAGLVAGLLAGSTMALSYGAPLLVLPLWVLLVVAVRRRRWAAVAAAVGGVAIVPAALALAGFDWVAGFRATRIAYETGISASRPYSYFLVADLAVFAVACGPAAIVGIAHPRQRSTWLLVGAALVAAVAADLSGLAKGEVERIWLPLVPFVVLAAGDLAGSGGRDEIRLRLWLGAQLLTAIVLEAFLRSPW